jgi:hypothetical protein
MAPSPARRSAYLASSTAPQGAYLATPSGTAVTPLITPASAANADERRLRALEVGVAPRPDPDARDRLATMLFQITGWEMFGADERAYISRLWARDWDSSEDSAYDEP